MRASKPFHPSPLWAVLKKAVMERACAGMLFWGVLCSTALADVTINGKTYQGSRVVVKEGLVIVDGKVVEEQTLGALTIVVNGTLEQLQSDRSVLVDGDIKGSVSASGTVKAQTIHGDVEATGSVKAGQIHGAVQAVGRVACKP